MKSIEIKPIGDRVLIRRHEETEEVRDGVIIPDRAREKQQLATVIAIGSGRRTEEGILLPIEVSVGDTVLISQRGGDEITLNDVVYTLARGDDILGIVTDAQVAITA